MVARDFMIPEERISKQLRWQRKQKLLGRCRICGGEKEFRNWLLETDFTTRTEHELVA